ncbi:MAG TPA: hypothetical protein DEU90_04280 [Enterobacter asburiae]|nr:hypothetical protein CIG53_06620 [Enterobacter asburiae]RAY99545.1 hypothetical protein DP195_00415 [Enterobacter asburiae]HBW96208.1 hypothetical protein [Enterobacter asburiae]HCF66773.1 hypothetical protein [Enterobacter asburiae]
MACQRKRRIEELVAIQIGHIDHSFINCRFQRHERTPFESGAHCSENRGKRLLQGVKYTAIKALILLK